MKLDAETLAAWQAALRRNPDARVDLPGMRDPWGRLTRPAQWGLSFYLTAFFDIDSPDRVAWLGERMPMIFEQFDVLTEGALTHEQHPSTGKILRRGCKSLPGIVHRFQDRSDVATINAFDPVTKESSPNFHFDTACDFNSFTKPGGKPPKMSYLSVRLSLGHWRNKRAMVQDWWRTCLGWLLPAQAYTGLAFTNQAVLERNPLIEPAEYALTQVFLGLDVDKPMFMRGSGYCEHDFHLELGTRTPTFGTLVRGRYLDRLGGDAAFRQALSAEPQIHVDACAGGLWIEAGGEPALYPADEGIPAPVACLAQALKPTRLDCLSLISFLPPVLRDDCFTPATARRWLKRFDDDGDWPMSGHRFSRLPT